jgi:MFS family permease
VYPELSSGKNILRTQSESFVTKWLSTSNKFLFTVFTATVAFLLYSCVYGFRKTFAIATFDDIVYLGVSYKVWLVIFQVIGYAVSKFIGIKIVSELKSNFRAAGILVLTFVAGLSWFLFAIVPAPYNIIFLFMNGIPLGMIWGLIFSYLEGRQTTDALGAGLSVSFIFSAGFSKTVGGFIMQNWGVSETWMPFVACLVFTPPLLVLLWLLDQVPPPTLTDQALRTKRMPMNKEQRRKFMMMFAPVLVVLIIAYTLLTALRDFRDNFSAEIWNASGFGSSPEIFTITEIPIAIVVLLTITSLIFVKNNRTALFINLYLVLAGFVILGVGTFLFERNVIGTPLWMILTGFGIYLGYVPFNCVLFERLIATFRITGTVGFVMYLADAFGYLGSVAVLLYKEFGQRNASWIDFYVSTGFIVSAVGIVLSCLSIVYFDRKMRTYDVKTLSAA